MRYLPWVRLVVYSVSASFRKSRDARLRIASPGNVAGYHVKLETKKADKGTGACSARYAYIESTINRLLLKLQFFSLSLPPQSLNLDVTVC